MWMKYGKEISHSTSCKEKEISTSNNINFFPQVIEAEMQAGWAADHVMLWCDNARQPATQSLFTSPLPGVTGGSLASPRKPKPLEPSSSLCYPLDPDTTWVWCGHRQKTVLRSSLLDPRRQRCQENSFDKCCLSKVQVDGITHTWARSEPFRACKPIHSVWDFGKPAPLFLLFFKCISFNWRIITLQYFDCFCPTSTWVCHRYIRASRPSWTPLPRPSL